MPSFAPARIARAVGARLLDLRSHVVLNPTAMRAIREADEQPVAADVVHLRAALDWLARAQDATPDDGFARGFSLIWNPYFRARGWQASYPETTGYIIPTLYAAARVLNEPVWSERARRAAVWEVEVQLENGAVQGGVIGQRRSPAIFNTGQVIFGWLAALEETGDSRFEAAVRRAGDFLVSVEHDGDWVQGNSQFARKDATAYNARAAWALAEAGAMLDERRYRDAAGRILLKTARQQHANGWFPACCLNDPQRPLLHTIAYTVRGLLEGGRVLHNEELSAAGMKAARALLGAVRADGWMPGRFDEQWQGAADWSCLTGVAQMANNWMRLAEITGDPSWRGHVAAAARYLKTRQHRSTTIDGLRGGIAGSSPLSGEYGRYEILNWATKYFADMMMRAMSVETATAPVTRLA
jgi:uncharacterized protein YyaL (SSP411 family)